MSRSLLLAAELVQDVADAVPGADRALLKAAIVDLKRRAATMADGPEVAPNAFPPIDVILASLRRLDAAAVHHDSPHADNPTH